VLLVTDEDKLVILGIIYGVRQCRRPLRGLSWCEINTEDPIHGPLRNYQHHHLQTRNHQSGDRYVLLRRPHN
jgi:hypothetical protein